ncbi:helix-turn-helix domain-containing protein [Catellatospora paridis]|uniref:helix-turn-helix domain-containing protein n=1 Tax=Catellatospora paridis TaxID=1617086 RepID=UPI0012D470A1|nr:helix-turn-helix domain-containing protein [Catellatospora paridis]
MTRKAVRLPDPTETPILTVPEAGRILGIGKNSAYEAARRQDFPVIKMGRLLRVPTAKFLEAMGLIVKPVDVSPPASLRPKTSSRTPRVRPAIA